MGEIFKNVINDCYMLVVVSCYVFIIVLVAIIVDLASGLRKAKLNNQYRSSEALRRTITKFIQYEGAVLIGLSIDMLLHMGGIFKVIEVIDLYNTPVMTLIIGIYNCVCEFISVRENADAKMKRLRKRVDGEIAEAVRQYLDDKKKTL